MLILCTNSKNLNEVSEKRLEAIKDFTELGSGFKIAMRDLSFEVGNLLGAQQHGFIDSVGFDMYSQMLSEAVARKQGKNIQDQKRLLKLIWALMLIFQNVHYRRTTKN